MWDIGIAKLLRERDNKSQIGTCIGTVVSISPLKIDIFKGEITLQEDQLYKCGHVYLHYYDNVKGTDLFIGDKVLLTSAELEQSFFIVDKVYKVGD